MSKNNFSCGIDFGTSNSTCSIFNGSNVDLVPLEKNSKILPSALFFPQEGQVTFGKEAITSYIEGEEGRLLRGLKSVLGTSLMQDRTMVSNKSLTFEEILSIYIANLKNKAESFLGESLENVVMGRPVYFHDNNTDADSKSEDVLRNIATKLGFKNINFQYEPIAAAYAHEQIIANEKIAIVVDLGGGTSDFTVIRLSPELALKIDRHDDILATTGIKVGGTNFDKSLSLAAFMPYLGLGSMYHSTFDKDKLLTVPGKIFNDLSDWPFIHQAQSPQCLKETKSLLRTAVEKQKIQRLLNLQEEQLGHAFLQEVESTKINLTDIDECSTNLENLGLDFTVNTSRQQFLQSIDFLIQRIVKSLDECLIQSGCKNSDISLIILTGGSSELPVINSIVQNKFPNAQISKDDKFGSVGRGLAYNAIQINKLL
jgi:hypothetical chaperone protein